MNWSLCIGLAAGFLLNIAADYTRHWIDGKRAARSKKRSAHFRAVEQFWTDSILRVSDAGNISTGLTYAYSRATRLKFFSVYVLQISIMVLVVAQSPYTFPLVQPVGAVFAMIFAIIAVRKMRDALTIERTADSLAENWHLIKDKPRPASQPARKDHD